MKCPKCDMEMENGLVSAGRGGMIWSEKPIKTFPTGVPYEYIPTKGVFITLKHLDSSRCTACRLIIMQYPEVQPEKPL